MLSIIAQNFVSEVLEWMRKEGRQINDQFRYLLPLETLAEWASIEAAIRKEAPFDFEVAGGRIRIK